MITLARLLRFLKLSRPSNDPPLLTPETVDARMDQLYPSFGKITGWRSLGGYQPMPLKARAALSESYRPYNAALYDYLGTDLAWDDEPSACLKLNRDGHDDDHCVLQVKQTWR